MADGAGIHLDRRLTAGETKASALAEVRDAAKRAGYPDAKVFVLNYAEAAYTGKVYPTEKYYPTWVLEEKSPYLKDAVAAYKGVLGKAPLVDKWTFSTNAIAIAGMKGIPCLGLGPGNEVYAHAPNEACPVEHLSAPLRSTPRWSPAERESLSNRLMDLGAAFGVRRHAKREPLWAEWEARPSFGY